MAPKKQKQTTSGDTNAPRAPDEGSMGRASNKRSKAAAAGGTNPRPYAAAAAEPGDRDTSASHQQQQQHDQQQQQQQRDLQRSLDVLLIVLERQRQAARLERVAKRLSRPVLTSDDEWALNGSGDDDGEQGAVTGGGWHSKQVIDYVDQSSLGVFRSRGGNDAAAVAAAADDASADRAFAGTCAIAARACKAWRAVVFRASDRLTVYIDGDAGKHVPSTSGTWQCEPASVLRACARGGGGGGLRALWLRGSQIDPAETPNAVRDLACALAVTEPTRRHPGPRAGQDDGLADVLRGLRVLKVDSAADVVSPLLTLPLCSPLPAPPLLSSVVDLTLDDYKSLYDSRERPFFFSRQHLPSLRALTVRPHKDSDCPLEIARGGGASGNDPAFLPPALTRLRVARQKFKYPSVWTPGEPLQASTGSLVALAPTLRSLWVDPVSGTPGSLEGVSGADAKRPRATSDMPDVLRDFARKSHNAPPPADLAPMRRLVPCLTSLTSVSSLRLSSDADWWPPEIILADDGSESHLRTHLQIKRMMEFHSAARAVLEPLASALRRLELKDGEALLASGMPVYLPPELSLLTGLTCLEIKAAAIAGRSATIAALTGLRRLSLEARNATVPGRAPPLDGGELASLPLLEHLCLSEPPSSIAPILTTGVPRLSSLVLWGDPPRRPYAGQPAKPALSVLRAALDRLERGTSVFFVAGVEDDKPPRRISRAELERAIVARE